MRGASRRGRGNRLVQNARDLDWAVCAGAEKVKGLDTDEGADFVLDGCISGVKPTFDLIENLGGEGLEEAETEGLGDGGVRAVEDDGGAANVGPLRVAVREEFLAGFSELFAGVGFGGFETMREGEIGEWHGAALPFAFRRSS